ncbi:hypothetical protein MT356_09465 [Rathayibacter festucae]|uniref:hypothetical protein n=1 Tax=Rathayibacter festucae TaxID=110937 RepID=UPI001FB3C2A6|nr:hypothetical protein [Rathayibacter festucae]MCJ1699950.1 hypothetical protein [Rathayibacter festucae]
MQFDSHRNLAQSLLAAVPVDRTAGTAFKVAPGDGSLFAPDMPVTLAPYGKDPSYDNAEIARITSVSGDSLVLERATEGSIRKIVQVGWVIAGTVTAGTLEAIEDAVLIKADQTYVDELVDGLDLRGDVRTVAGRTGNVVLSKADVGLNLIDNTSDAAKPVSAPVQTALDAKYNASNPAGFVDAFQAAASAPVQTVAGKQGAVTLAKGDVGLSNVDNTSDASKPVSTATSNALATKIDKVEGLGLSSNDYTGTEKTKLAGIASGATANAADASLRNRATHTGTQAVSTVVGLQTALDGKLVTTGGTITGALTVQGAQPIIYLSETDQTAPAGVYRIDVQGDLIRFIRSSTVLATLGPNGLSTTLPITGISGTLSAPGSSSDSIAVLGQILSKQDKATTVVGVGTYATDGVADHIQLQAAIDATHSAGGGIVQYVKPLYVDSLITLYADVVLVGGGDRTPIRPSASFGAGVVLRENSGTADGLTLIDVTVDCGLKPNVGGIHIYQGSYVRLIRPHVYNMAASEPNSKWGLRVGHYVNGTGDDIASKGLLIEDSIIKNCHCGTFEQMLIVNQQDYTIVRPYFEGNTNQNAYELMLYINNKNGVVDRPVFKLPLANSIGMMESEAITINDITAQHTSDYKLVTIINTRAVLIDGIQAKNSMASPIAAIIDMFDREFGPDGFTQIVDDTKDVTIQNAYTSGWKSFGSALIAGTSLGTNYTQNMSNIQWINIFADGTNVPFNIGLDSPANNLRDWYFDNVRIASWSGANVGAFQIRGQVAAPSAVSGFRFNRVRVAASTGAGSAAAIRAIAMTVESVENSDLSALFPGYGPLSAVNGATFAKQLNNKGMGVSQRSAATTLDATYSSVELNTTATQTLPALATCQGRMYEFVNINAAAATIKGNGTELIGNVTTANTYTLASGAAVTLKAFPSAWRVV